MRYHRNARSELLTLKEHLKALEKKVCQLQKKEQPSSRRNSNRNTSNLDIISENKAPVTPSQDASDEQKAKKLSVASINVAKSKEEVSNFFIKLLSILVTEELNA